MASVTAANTSTLEPDIGLGIEGIDLDHRVPGYISRLQAFPLLGVDDPGGEGAFAERAFRRRFRFPVRLDQYRRSLK